MYNKLTPINAMRPQLVNVHICFSCMIDLHTTRVTKLREILFWLLFYIPLLFMLAFLMSSAVFYLRCGHERLSCAALVS